MARVYLETSLISACVTSRTDAASIYRRDISREWWTTQRQHHELFLSAEVINELSDPGYPSSREALEWIAEVPLLALDDQVLGFAGMLVQQRVMPAPVGGDAVHVAVASVHACDYLLTWNVRHLANRNKIAHLRAVCLRAGLFPPQILTPDLLWEPVDESTAPNRTD